MTTQYETDQPQEDYLSLSTVNAYLGAAHLEPLGDDGTGLVSLTELQSREETLRSQINAAKSVLVNGGDITREQLSQLLALRRQADETRVAFRKALVDEYKQRQEDVKAEIEELEAQLQTAQDLVNAPVDRATLTPRPAPRLQEVEAAKQKVKEYEDALAFAEGMTEDLRLALIQIDGDLDAVVRENKSESDETFAGAVVAQAFDQKLASLGLPPLSAKSQDALKQLRRNTLADFKDKTLVSANLPDGEAVASTIAGQLKEPTEKSTPQEVGDYATDMAAYGVLTGAVAPEYAGNAAQEIVSQWQQSATKRFDQETDYDALTREFFQPPSMEEAGRPGELVRKEALLRLTPKEQVAQDKLTTAKTARFFHDLATLEQAGGVPGTAVYDEFFETRQLTQAMLARAPQEAALKVTGERESALDDFARTGKVPLDWRQYMPQGGKPLSMIERTLQEAATRQPVGNAFAPPTVPGMEAPLLADRQVWQGWDSANQQWKAAQAKREQDINLTGIVPWDQGNPEWQKMMNDIAANEWATSDREDVQAKRLAALTASNSLRQSQFATRYDAGVQQRLAGQMADTDWDALLKETQGEEERRQKLLKPTTQPVLAPTPRTFRAPRSFVG